MERRRLMSADDALFAPAFALYENAFPLHERRTADQQQALMLNPACNFDLYLENGCLAGLLAHWDFAAYTYIEHLAVSSEMRGRSLGSAILTEFCRNHELVVLEIDPPADDISRRREAFYQRLGFEAAAWPHSHPPYRPGFDPHKLVVMSRPRKLSADEYSRFAEDLSLVVMGDCR